MTPEAQRIAIARVCPSAAFIDQGMSYWKNKFEHYAGAYRPSHAEFDPLADLNAMHEAEKALTKEWQDEYIFLLSEPFRSDCGHNWRAAHATAAQRAEAFLRTIGKWVE